MHWWGQQLETNLAHGFGMQEEGDGDGCPSGEQEWSNM